MNTKQQARVVELKRRIKAAVAALQAVDQCLDLEQDGPIGTDVLAEKIRAATKAGLSRRD